MSAVGDARKRLAESTQPDPTAAAVRAAQAEAWDEGFQDGRRQDAEGDDGPRFINPYRADRLATDTAAPEGSWLDEEYAENLIGFVRTFETGEHAANALPIFLRSVMRPAAPVAVEGVETVEAWTDRHGDVWRLGDDGLMHSFETAPFSREYVEKKWGPLRPTREWSPVEPEDLRAGGR